MTRDQAVTTGGATALRRAFDQSFAELPTSRAEDTESVLALQSGSGAYAVRLAEITGLLADRTIVRLSSSISEFLGVAGLRRGVVPVYSLRSLLGYAMSDDPPRWLMMAGAGHPVAFAFERFEGILRVRSSAVLRSKDQTEPAHVPATLHLADGTRGLLSVGSLLETIEDRIRRLATTKEH